MPQYSQSPSSQFVVISQNESLSRVGGSPLTIEAEEVDSRVSRGLAYFDLSSVDEHQSIGSATLSYTVDQADLSGGNLVHARSVDLAVSESDATLFSGVPAGVQAGPLADTTGSHSLTLSSAAVDSLKDAVKSQRGWFALGFSLDDEQAASDRLAISGLTLSFAW